MSRRTLNIQHLAIPAPPPSAENILETVMVKPKPVQHFVPDEPIFLTKEQWDMLCTKTYDATTPFTVTVTVDDKISDTLVGDVKDLAVDDVDESREKDAPYIPKRIRKNKK